MDSSWLFLIINVLIFLGILRLFLRSPHTPALSTSTQSFPNFLSRVAQDRRGYFTGQTQVTIVCLTGGPCGGKTSVIAKMVAQAQQHNIRVYYHPDTESLIRSGGFLTELKSMSKSQQFHYVQTLLRMQMNTENMFFSMAKHGVKKSLILVERGLLDYKLMLEPEMWEGLLNENGLKESDLSDSRYHLVIHLETAACGVEEIFNKWNGGSWTLQSAIELDNKLKDVWLKHHSFRTLRNMHGLQGFEHKMEEAVKDIIAYTNPASIRTYKRKFLVLCDDPKTWTEASYAQDNIETTYLNPASFDQEREKVEARVATNGDSIYIRKVSYRPDDQSKEITKNRSVLTPREYLLLLTRAISKEKVKKTRYSFHYKTHHYALTKYHGKREWVMRVLTWSKEDAVHVPSFVKLIGLLAEDVQFSLGLLHDEELEVQPTPLAEDLPQSPDIQASEDGKTQFDELKLNKADDSPPQTTPAKTEEVKEESTPEVSSS